MVVVVDAGPFVGAVVHPAYADDGDDDDDDDGVVLDGCWPLSTSRPHIGWTDSAAAAVVVVAMHLH